MRPRSVRSAPPLSLFPFLAVLVCTLGGLIVLFVIVVQNAKVQAARAPSPQMDPGDPAPNALQSIRQQIEDYRWKVEMLVASRQQTSQRLSQERLELSHLEDHTRALRQRLDQLQAEAKTLDQGDGNDSQNGQTSQQDLAALEQLLEQTRSQLAQLRQAWRDRPTSYAIIPYDGQSGTQRRPIYIECRADAVILQPEGIALGDEDFQEPIGPDSPLAAALRAKREYLATVGMLDQGEPYPLLIVRPDGAVSYAATRMALRDWDAEFGYELVEQERRLVFGVADPYLTEHLRRVVEQARERHRRERQFALALESAGPSPTLRASHRGGFIVQGSGTPRPDESARRAARWLGATDSPYSPEDEQVLSHPQQRAEGTAQPGPEPSAEQAAGHGRATADHPATEAHDPTARNPVAPGEATQGAGRPREAKPVSPQLSSGHDGPGGAAAIGDARQSLAHSRGRDWALPQRAAGAIGVTRPIRLECSADYIVMPADRNDQTEARSWNLNESLPSVVDDLVQQIWKRIERWGIAGPGMFWRPVLVVQVAPGGESVYQLLATLLEGSGVLLERKQP